MKVIAPLELHLESFRDSFHNFHLVLFHFNYFNGLFTNFIAKCKRFGVVGIDLHDLAESRLL